MLILYSPGTKGYYRVGDRVAVGDVFGDVYRIDLLTTTLWEIGAPFREGFVHAEQPTGRLVTFPNNAILTGTVINLTRDFPYVWDELSVQVANESDLAYTMDILQKCARELFSTPMAEAARLYSDMLEREGLDTSIAEEPRVFVSLAESWTDVTIRYLVGVRERRKWKSELSLLVLEKLNREDHGGRVLPVYPRRQIQFIDREGVPGSLPNGIAVRQTFTKVTDGVNLDFPAVDTTFPPIPTNGKQRRARYRDEVSPHESPGKALRNA